MGDKNIYFQGWCSRNQATTCRRFTWRSTIVSWTISWGELTKSCVAITIQWRWSWATQTPDWSLINRRARARRRRTAARLRRKRAIWEWFRWLRRKLPKKFLKTHRYVYSNIESNIEIIRNWNLENLGKIIDLYLFVDTASVKLISQIHLQRTLESAENMTANAEKEAVATTTVSETASRSNVETNTKSTNRRVSSNSKKTNKTRGGTKNKTKQTSGNKNKVNNYVWCQHWHKYFIFKWKKYFK